MKSLAATFQVFFRAALRGASVLVALLLTLQVSGLAHAVTDICLSREDAVLHFTDDDAADCPPGCPSCHHPNAGANVPQRAAPAPECNRPPDRPLVASTPYTADAPRGPMLPSVYRPPRA